VSLENYNLVTQLTITNHKKAFFFLLFLLLVFCFIKEILLQDQEIFLLFVGTGMCEKTFFLIIFLRILKIGMRACHIGLIHKRRKKKNFFFLTFMCHFSEWKKAQNEKMKELEGTVVIMETAGFSSFFSYFFLLSSFLAKD